ncbi:MAG: NADH-quinone oxidoreductase subunit NuoF [Clostridia bacterium]|nr:NADH-quinone oxidoreductase subunit NuoF [Clostridia bacterium]
MFRSHVLICGGTGCTSSGSQALFTKLESELQAKGLENEIKIVQTGCFGLCALGPIMIVYPEGTFYSRVTAEDIPEIVEEHLLKGRIVERLVYNDAADDAKVEETIASLSETQFYKKQKRVALRNCGVINPEVIDEYIAMDGYFALAKVVKEMTPEDVINTILASGLRGRGGGGFPTGRKWQFARASVSDKKYVVCNADEGDPGAFMDRSVLEGDPHALLEAMAIAGYAIGADEGWVYVRAEYPIAVKRLNIAIEQAREMGLLGKNIFGTDFNFDIHIRLGAGAFVCGEETALLTSIEGNRGEPRPRPPFPAVKGLWGKPTIINNVETYANIPQIILNGADWFASMGTEKSKGTKVFALGGKIRNTGLVEVPMGTTLREIIEEIGGGIPNGKHFKAAQTGGPSGGCIPASLIDVPIDYDNLIEIGSMMGSGGLIVMDEDTCMVDLAKFFLEFTVDESCGKCAPCRIGTVRMLEILNKITDGNGEMEDLDKLEELANYVKSGSLCGLGQTAPNPILSTLRYFRDEYVAHIVDKKCPAGVCKKLLNYTIDPDKCKGCTLCARQCPAGAITGKVKEVHVIDPAKCVKCGACVEKCKFGAISRK